MSLLLARAIARRREIGIRLALGASRRRLVEQLVLEGLVLATLGGAVGAALSFLLRVVAKLFPIIGLQIDLTPNARVLAFSILLSWATAMLFAVLPALDATRLDVASAFKGLVTRGPRQRRRSRLRSVVVAIQVAAGALLLSLAADVARSAARAGGADLGFATKNVTALQLNLSQLGYDGVRAAYIYHALTARLSETPGVQAIGLASQLPLLGQNVETIEVRDSATGTWTRARQSGVTYATHGYLNALEVRVLRGRAVDDTTAARSTPGTAVVSSALASALWPSREGIGKRIRVGQQEYVVTAIAADARMVSPTSEHEPFAYLSPPAGSVDLAIVVRTRAPMAGLEQMVRRTTGELDANILVRSDRFDERISTVLRPAQLTALVAGTAGALALVLALVGIYGTVSYAVRQRAHELSVRLALGATPGRVVALVLLDGSRPVLTGVAVGGGLAAAGGVLVRSVLAGVGTSEPLVLLAAVLGSLVICYVAMLLPAIWA
ncbi:MAG TPA: FtsX-like permease family protein, partial [Polyangiales bacterium]